MNTLEETAYNGCTETEVVRACHPRVGDLVRKGSATVTVTGIRQGRVWCTLQRGEVAQASSFPLAEWRILVTRSLAYGATFRPTLDPEAA